MENQEKERIIRENRDLSHENRENKEDNKMDKELRAAAALERADYLSREVKTSQNQMQNIMLHIQAVLQAIKELRKVLSLPESGADSIQEDQRQVEKLRERITGYREELEKMKGDLILEHIKKLHEDNPQALPDALEAEATRKVEELYASLSEE